MPNVVLHNKLPHSVTVAVQGADGKLSALKLAGAERSDPIPENRITQHARTLAQRGHIKIRASN